MNLLSFIKVLSNAYIFRRHPDKPIRSPQLSPTQNTQNLKPASLLKEYETIEKNLAVKAYIHFYLDEDSL